MNTRPTSVFYSSSGSLYLNPTCFGSFVFWISNIHPLIEFL
ncbi:hypothetical protein CHCC20331_2329 [Bacillus paralicheniformis]|nr:hypothetical protein CHCC5021_4485 [Bacillus paralicheniformis]TWK86968.1 hypothetical protein CHCC20331_2329 [Bacillus paralicheniformis]TWL07929.1 hypothetical protein CHCC19468_4161 [Bacillus paralicheniformis]TWL20589.1 hypothetical protein CHCC19467_2921 [Bacillus paralicheniformis]TWL39784.1 hypothetical protein CHCC15337_0795 [Bacillus paralicheniformis]